MPCADIVIGRRHRVCEVMERVLAEDWLDDPHASPLESGSPGSDDRDSGGFFSCTLCANGNPHVVGSDRTQSLSPNKTLSNEAMDLIVQCSRCETKFRIDRTQGRAHVICPSCKWRFDASQAKLRKAQADTLIATGESIDGPAAAVANPLGTLAQTHGSSSDDEVNLNAIKRIKTKRMVRHRKKVSPWPTILALLGLTAFVALFGGYVYHVRQKQIEMAALQKENEMRAQPAPPARTRGRRPIADTSQSTHEIPMPEPDDLSLAMADPEPDPLPRDPAPVPIDPIRRLLETLGQSGEQCKAFQFLPESESQYEQLQTFALQLSLAKALLDDHQDGELDPQDRDALTEGSVQWLQTMKALVTQAAVDAPERLPRINVFAEREFEKGSSLDKANSQIVFYGFVFLRGKQETDSILKFDRKQVYYSVPVVPEFERTGNESYRFYFVETPETPSQKRTHSPGGGLIKVSSANLIYAFDPMDSE